MTGTGVSRKEACSLRESLASPKSIIKIGTWNVRTMYQIGKTAVVAREMRKLGEELPKEKERLWVLARGTRQRWLPATVQHGGEECPALCPLRALAHDDDPRPP